ncbi:hypothetical protein GmHk_02G003972 [Glycine max]|nr:hypothetical protein GmHk_02G003972 [Glycine max]
MNSTFHMIHNTIRTGLCVRNDQRRLVSTMTFCKMVIDKINIACEDLIELRNIVVECRKILISHPSYRQVNGVAHELARVTPLFPKLYSINHVVSYVKHLIHNEMRTILFSQKKKG